MEEMHASTREIAKNAGDAARVAGQAVEIADTTTRTVGRLDESSRNVEKVIKVITSISQQTNLLALNATIEAARAGEAGKGFAVVAKEVKELATETGRATEEIGRMIAAIQGDTGDSVAAIGQISQIIHEISALQTTIAGAVEQQSAASHQITLNVHDAARGSAEIASGIMRVAETATDTSASVHEGQKATESLTRMARDLHDVVSRFRL
jgi:methyl-accepting chemotaxis protein